METTDKKNNAVRSRMIDQQWADAVAATGIVLDQVMKTNRCARLDHCVATLKILAAGHLFGSEAHRKLGQVQGILIEHGAMTFENADEINESI